MRKVNNKGFTLVELLAVMVILIIIMMIAIPNISSSIERSKNKQDIAMQKVIKSAGELYVSKHRSSLNLDTNNRCYITIENLIGENYLDADDVGDYKDSCLVYDNVENKIYYSSAISSGSCTAEGFNSGKECMG